MKKDEIKDLIREFDQSSLTELAITQQDISVYMNKNNSSNYRAESASNIVETIDSPKIETISTIADENKESNVNEESDNLEVIASPIVGVIYLQSAPGEAEFVQVGQHVKKGDVVCLIEAMKLMNEIVSPFDGTVKKITINNEDVVEYNQPLFMIEP